MNCTIVFTVILLSVCLNLSQSSPVNSNNPYQAFNSPVDITGQPVREPRSQQDTYICYPSSVVYGYHNNPNAIRRSGEANRPVSAFDSYQALTDRADRERAAYKDSFGK